MSPPLVSVPSINVQGLPEAERNPSWFVQRSLTGLSSQTRDFHAALELFDFCDYLLAKRAINHWQYAQWQLIAARDGAMIIYHFGTIIEGTNFRECPTLGRVVDHDKLRSARSKFQAKFPWKERLRHSVGHAAELADDQKSYEKNAARGPLSSSMVTLGDGASMVLLSSLKGRTFATTYKGTILTYDMDSTTAAFLNEIAGEFYSGFDQVSAKGSIT